MFNAKVTVSQDDKAGGVSVAGCRRQSDNEAYSHLNAIIGSTRIARRAGM